MRIVIMSGECFDVHSSTEASRACRRGIAFLASAPGTPAAPLAKVRGS